MQRAAAAIAIEDDRVLIARRARVKILSGYWEFPGGKIEHEETPAGCAAREIREELGVDCSAGDELLRYTHVYPGGTVEIIAIAVELQNKSFSLSVHDAVRWVSYPELACVNMAPFDAEVVRYLNYGRSF